MASFKVKHPSGVHVRGADGAMTHIEYGASVTEKAIGDARVASAWEAKGIIERTGKAAESPPAETPETTQDTKEQADDPKQGDKSPQNHRGAGGKGNPPAQNATDTKTADK